MVGLSYFISNRGDLTSLDYVYKSDGTLLVWAFIDPSLDGSPNGQTGIAYDGTNYYISDILSNRLLEYSGTGTFIAVIDSG